MVFDMERPKYKESTTCLGLRGRDAVRKSTLKVNILQVITIGVSEVHFIVNRDSRSGGLGDGAWSGAGLRGGPFL